MLTILLQSATKLRTQTMSLPTLTNGHANGCGAPKDYLPLDIAASIRELRSKKNAIILAHYYQESEIQDIADYIGDSLGLAQQAASTKADLIVFAGVRFMAETAKILNPQRKVVLPDLDAGCSLADNCPADQFAAFRSQYPNHVVVSYVNCSVEVKALSDILCTSTNAVKVIQSFPEDQPILFAPDQHLGRYLVSKTGRKLVLWPGSCIVHETFDHQRIVKLKARYQNALVIAHPECTEAVLAEADFIGSTSQLLQFVKDSPKAEFIVVTEPGIIHQMEKACPEKKFYPAPAEDGCACNRCPFMRLNTLEKLYLALRDESPTIELSNELCERARQPLERMLALS